MDNKVITPELRNRCRQKLRELDPELLKSVNPEIIEMTCFQKSNHDTKIYVDLVRSFINRQRQFHSQRLQQQHALIGQPYNGQMIPHGVGLATTNHSRASPSVIGQPDPLNALQTLTVTAGGQTLPGSSCNVSPSSIRCTTVAAAQYSPNIRHRPSTSINSSSSSKHAMPMVDVQHHMINQSPLAPQPQLHHRHPTIHTGQSASPGKTALGSTALSATPAPSVLPDHSHNAMGSDQPPNKKVMYSSASPHKPVLAATTESRPPSTTVVDPAEAARVRIEIARLRDRFLPSLKAVITKGRSNDNDAKVWGVLRSILENPDSISKPVSLKHIPKIEQHLNRAEQFLAAVDPVLAQYLRSHASPAVANPTVTSGSVSSTTSSSLPTQLPASTATTASKSSSSIGELSVKPLSAVVMVAAPDNGPSNSPASFVDCDAVSGQRSGLLFHQQQQHQHRSLDMAFDTVCEQLSRCNGDAMTTIQKRLLEQVRFKLPKYEGLVTRNRSRSQNSRKEEIIAQDGCSDAFDPHEFDFVARMMHDPDDGYGWENETDAVATTADGGQGLWDRSGQLRTDIDPYEVIGHADLETELSLLSSEFEVEEVGDDLDAYRCFRLTYRWGGSQEEKIVGTLPAVLARVPLHYDMVGVHQWDLTSDDVTTDTDNNNNNNHSGRRDLSQSLHCLFQLHNQAGGSDGISLAHLASLYKKAVQSTLQESQQAGGQEVCQH